MDLETQIADGVLSLCLNRPERLNALTSSMIHALANALREGQADRNVGAIVLRGEGRAFCAGDDLDELSAAAHDKTDHAKLLDALQEITWQIMTGPKPVIAAVQGWALGAAFSWLLNSDVVICATGAKASFPEMKWGVTPTGAATALLPNALGLTAARSAFFRRRLFSSDDLFQVGLANQVVDDGDETRVAMEVAQQLAAGAANAICAVKTMTLRSMGFDLHSVLELEKINALAVATAPDTAHRIATNRN